MHVCHAHDAHHVFACGHGRGSYGADDELDGVGVWSADDYDHDLVGSGGEEVVQGTESQCAAYVHGGIGGN